MNQMNLYSVYPHGSLTHLSILFVGLGSLLPDTGDWLNLVTLIAAIAALVKAIWFSKPEREKLEAETIVSEADAAKNEAEAAATAAKTIATYQEIIGIGAKNALEAEKRYQEKFRQQDERISKLEKTVAELQTIREVYEREKADLQDLVDRLAYQVQSLGGTPVKMRERKEE